ncbi:MAG TPA: ATP-grasp domain-containing protein [Candidatus Saccharimonadales bacterium]
MSRIIVAVGSRSEEQLSQESLARVSGYAASLVADEDIACRATFMDDILYTIGEDTFEAYDTRNDLLLNDVACILLRGHGIVSRTDEAFYLSTFCEQNHISCPTSYAVYYPATKVAQAIIFREVGVPFLRTLYIANPKKLIRYAEERFGYPYILKDGRGERGESNYLIRSLEQAQAALQAEPTIDFIAQEFCPNDRDYRLLVMGDSHLIIERRGPSDSHLNNTSQGGKATLRPDDLPQSIIDQAHVVMKRLGLLLAGIDVIPHLETGKYYFLEINTQPQVQTGLLLEEKQQLMREFLVKAADAKRASA